GAHAAYNLKQLRDIEDLINDRNCGGLRWYLKQNPAILEGGDALAQELRQFAEGVDSGLIDCIAGIEPAKTDGSELNDLRDRLILRLRPGDRLQDN
nr:hypothetical protein [Paracoccaceae bacterium]